MRNIYISYSSRDAVIYADVYQRLTRAGYLVWRDQAPRPGQDWKPAMDEAIRVAHAVLVLLTPNSADSVYVTYEWALAMALGIRVIVVRVRPVNALHERLNQFDQFDMAGFRDPNAFWGYFIEQLPRLAGMGNDGGIAPMLPNIPAPIAAPMPQQLAVPPLPQAPLPQIDRSLMPIQPGKWLVMRRGPQQGTMYKLQGETIALGRDPSMNDIVIDDSEISRQHCRLMWTGSQFLIQDLGSMNGTRINGAPITGQVPLLPGAIVQLSDVVILSYEVVV